MREIRNIIFVLSLAAGFVRAADGQVAEKQWQSLAAFPNTIYTVYFIGLPGPPRIGFAGSKGMVYRTSDGGTTWNTTVADDYNFEAWDFVFKDSLTGWFANWVPGNFQCFKTIDGGMTWKAMSAPVFNATSLFYNPYNKLLFISGWGQIYGTGTLCISSDDGTTWNTVQNQTDFNGLAFLNSDSGLVTHEYASDNRTKDGGKSWSPIDSDANESFQPLADTFRNVYWAASERGVGYPLGRNISILYESFNAGESFRVVDTIPSITGTMREGSCGSLYLQSTGLNNDSLKGILQSQDGMRWMPLRDAFGNSGPYADVDTRFFVAGTYIFAAGQTAADASIRIWRYIGDSTKYGGEVFAAPVASTKHFNIASTGCNDLDSLIFIDYQNDCIPAEIESAQIGDSSHFTLQFSSILPHQIKGFDSILIGHIPTNRLPDSTILYLQYFANGKTLFDTVFVTAAIAGANIIAPFDILANGSKNAQVGGGDTVDFRIFLTDSLAQIGLDSLRFQMSFDGNVLSFKSASAASPWTILNEAHSEGVETITLSNSNTLPALENSPIADIIYTADISKDPSTNYLITDMYLNDIEFDGCAGPASLPLPPMVTVSGCGDTILRQEMAGGSILQLLKIEENDGIPAISFRSPESGPVEITIFDILGREIRTIETVSQSGVDETVPLPGEGLQDGLYFVSIAAGGNSMTDHARVSSKFLIGGQ